MKKRNFKLFLFLLIINFLFSCTSVSERSSALLSELLDVLKPLYIEAKLLSQEGKLDRIKRGEYLKKFNDALFNHLVKQERRYNEYKLIFQALNDSDKMNVSVEFNNYYYDATEGNIDEDDEEERGINKRISFYELLTEHRTLVAIDSKKYDDLRQTITLKKFEAVILKDFLNIYRFGDFDIQITATIERIVTNMLMKNFENYKKEEAVRLKSMRTGLGEQKFDLMVSERAMKRIEQSKGLIGVFVKRYIRNDLTELLGENFFKLSADKIRNACLTIINRSEEEVKKLEPEYEKEKVELEEYRKVYQVEYPRFEKLVEHWSTLNPIFSFANQTGSPVE